MHRFRNDSCILWAMRLTVSISPGQSFHRCFSCREGPVNRVETVDLDAKTSLGIGLKISLDLGLCKERDFKGPVSSEDMDVLGPTLA